MPSSRFLLAPVLAALTVASVIAGPPAGGEEAPAQGPARIVSLNVCTDQLLMMLADPARIASLSYLSARPENSSMAEEAAQYPLNHAQAEEIVAIDPDLVITGTFSARPAVQLLRRLGYEIVELPPENSFAEIRTNIRALGTAIGEAERAEAMVAKFDADLSALRVEADDERPLYADIGANGYVAGSGSLTEEVAEAAGFRTLGGELGLGWSGQVSIEQLIVSRPDVISLDTPYDIAPALATEILRHPALRHLAREGRQIELPDRYLACGTPHTLNAVAILAEAYREWEAAQ